MRKIFTQKIFTQKNILLALKITLPILCACVLAFIFGQSLQTGEQSSKTSSIVVETVQAVFKIIAPQSALATAEGEALQRLHAFVRILAHFTEFALLGVLACGICLVYTRGNIAMGQLAIEHLAKDKKAFSIGMRLGVASLFLVPIIDESIQFFTPNRAMEWIDIAVDIGGGCVGFGLTLACFYGIVRWIKNKKNKRSENIMTKESMEIALIKYNKKTWCKSAILGFFVGIAVIVPGISGSTVAIIFKLYDQFLYALGNLMKKFKPCFMFLLPIGIGLVAGFLLGLLGVQKLLEINMFAIVCLFAGLMSGAFPAVKDEIKGAKITAKRVALFIVGLMIPVIMGAVSAWNTATTQTIDTELAGNIFEKVQWFHVILGLGIGFIVGITQIVPGMSASAFLMTVGWYNSLMSSVSLTYWKSNFAILFVYAGLGIGFLLGLLLFSKLLTHLFSVARHTSYCMIVGLSLGSIVSMFCNGDIINVYLHWTASTMAWDIVLGVVLFAIGCVGAYMLVRVQRKQDEKDKMKIEQ